MAFPIPTGSLAKILEKGGVNPNQTGTYEDYKDQAVALSTAMYTGSPEEQVAASRQLSDIVGKLSSRDAEDFKDLVSKTLEQTMSTAAKSQGEPGITKEQAKIIRAEVGTNLGLGLLKTGTGIVQVLDAAFKKKKLTPPKLPQDLYKNPQLATQIAQSMTRADQGDQGRQQAFDEQLTEGRAVNNARAKSAGTIGQYLSNVQSDASRANKAKRDFAVDESRLKTQERGLLARLTSESAREDARIKNTEFRKFAFQNQAYNNSLQALQQQQNSGFNNAFIGANELAGAIPGAVAANQVLQQGSGNTGGGGLLSQMKTISSDAATQTPSARPQDIGFDDQVGPFAPKISPTVSLGKGQMLMLGSPAYRTPENVELFQQMAQQQGYNNLIPGQWDETTDKAYKDMMTINPFTGLNQK